MSAMRRQSRRFSIPILFVLAAIGGAAAIVWLIGSTGTPTSASELAIDAERQLAEASEQCRAGGIVYLKQEDYIRERRAAPPELVAEGAFDYPDRVIDESWIACDSNGEIRDYAGLLSTVDGTELQRTRFEADHRVFTDVKTGAEQRFELGGEIEWDVAVWIAGQANMLQRALDDDFEVVDRDADIDGTPAIELSRQYRLGASPGLGDDAPMQTDGEPYRRTLLISTDDPFVYVSTLYRIADTGELEKVLEHRVLQWEVLPPGSRLGDRP